MCIRDRATSAALVAATLQLTATGIPVIYYGEEVGLSGLNNYPYQTNRYDMDFSKATKDNVCLLYTSGYLCRSAGLCLFATDTGLPKCDRICYNNRQCNF